jgi:hypothetical protein
MKFDRVYHDYRSWEEIAHNMWGEVTDRDYWLWQAVAFTGDHKKYGSYMRRVATEWPVSCENALTDSSLNQKAWIGHAACALAMNVPEDIVRKAWGYLTDEQRFLANEEARRTIQRWKHDYATRLGLHPDLEETLL